MARYRVVMTHPDGSRVVLAKTRRYNGAVHERDAAVESKVAVWLKHSNGDRVIQGPTEEPDTIAVVLLADHGDIVYRYGIEVDSQRMSQVQSDQQRNQP